MTTKKEKNNNMQIQEIKTLISRKNKKRIGRGGKRGTTSGKGQKGQRARSGHRIRPAERDIFSKFPKLRGVKNKSLAKKPLALNLGDIEKKFSGEKSITKDTLKKFGLIKSTSVSIKILATGEIKTPFIVEGMSVSESARKKIEAAGGSVK
jgi:large subunit ribosomal protein L15